MCLVQCYGILTSTMETLLSGGCITYFVFTIEIQSAPKEPFGESIDQDLNAQ